jgi:hypothetical protein
MQNIIFLHTNSYKNKFIEFMDFYIAKYPLKKTNWAKKLAQSVKQESDAQPAVFFNKFV